jgi:two-component system, cell cycle response regulator CpdR
MTPSNQRHPLPPPNPSSILLLDDDFDTVTSIKRALQEYSFSVYTFTDPYLALEHYKANVTSYSLVISDFKMQGMNGVEFITKVKEIRPEVKVLLMSSFDINRLELSNILTTSAKNIIDGFIQKPISIEEMTIIINKHIKRIKNSQETL